MKPIELKPSSKMTLDREIVNLTYDEIRYYVERHVNRSANYTISEHVVSKYHIESIFTATLKVLQK